MAPVLVTNSTLPVTTPVELRDYLKRGALGLNSLDVLAAGALLAKLNIASGSGQATLVDADLAASSRVLLACAPNSPTAYAAVLHGTKCAGYSALQIRTLALRLLTYSNGELGPPLCDDIGKERPSKPRNLMITQGTK
jgi:hypothetical protein